MAEKGLWLRLCFMQDVRTWCSFPFRTKLRDRRAWPYSELKFKTYKLENLYNSTTCLNFYVSKLKAYLRHHHHKHRRHLMIQTNIL